MDPSPTWRPLVEAYLDDLRARCSPGHVRTAESYLSRLLRACPHATRAEVVAWRACQLGDLSHRTINYAVATLAAALRFGQDAGLLAADPLGRVRRLPYSEGDMVHARRALTDPEIDAFLEAAREIDAGLLVPQAILWETLIESGVRWSEAAALRPEDLDGVGLIVRARHAKTRRARRVPLPPGLPARLARIGWPGLVFLSPNGQPWTPNNHRAALRLFHRTREAAGIQRRDEDGRVVDIHALRTTAASRMLRRGVPDRIVAAVLGHRDTEMIARHYADIHAGDVAVALARTWATTT